MEDLTGWSGPALVADEGFRAVDVKIDVQSVEAVVGMKGVAEVCPDWGGSVIFYGNVEVCLETALLAVLGQ